ncbi:MAG: hypothetical protein IJN92_06915 [Lachnospiraceae bacterium]|nr:hypothetical protein [Lachnospiraceae bacterium]
MTTQGLIIMVVVLIVIVAAFAYDKKKADKTRADYDQQFDGKHVCDFSNIYYTGFIAEDKLVLKDRTKGYLIIDLKQVKKINKRINRGDGSRTIYVLFGDETGKQVENSRKIKPMSSAAADELIDHVLRNTNWIELV